MKVGGRRTCPVTRAARPIGRHLDRHLRRRHVAPRRVGQRAAARTARSAARVRRPTGDGRRGAAPAGRCGERRAVVRSQRVAGGLAAGGLARLPHPAGNHQGVGVGLAAHRRGVLRCRPAAAPRRDRRRRRQARSNGARPARHEPPAGRRARPHAVVGGARRGRGRGARRSAVGTRPSRGRRAGVAADCARPMRPCWNAPSRTWSRTRWPGRRLQSGEGAGWSDRRTPSTCGSSTGARESRPTNANGSSCRSNASAIARTTPASDSAWRSPAASSRRWAHG